MTVFTLALSYQPLLPLWVIGPVLLGAAGLSIWLSVSTERRVGIALLRLFAIGAMGWALLNPVRLVPATDHAGARPSMEILVDTSGSMNQVDAGPNEDVGRLAYAQQTWLAGRGLDRIRAVADITLQSFDVGVSTLGVVDEASGRATNLFDAAQRRRADLTVLVTDGHDTSGRGLPTLDPLSGRLYAVPIGSPRSAPDVALQAWADADRLFPGQSATLTAQLYQRGLAGREVIVELSEDGQLLESKRVKLASSIHEQAFTITPDLVPNQPATVHGYRLTARLADGDEASIENNHEDIFVQVSRDRVRVLLLEGEPHWETRGMARVLSQSPRFTVTARYALGDRRRLDLAEADTAATEGSGTEPGEVFAGYDVVILGRKVERLLSAGQAAALVDFVQEQGGAVVFSRGRPVSRTSAPGKAVMDELGLILPVDFGQERAEQTRLEAALAGRGGPLAELDDRLAWTELPGMLAVTRIEGRRAASVVVLETDGKAGGSAPPTAAVVTLRMGQGAVLAVLSDGLWRWPLAGGTPGAMAYEAFWTRSVQWLAAGGAFLPGQDVALELSALSTEPGKPIVATVSTRFVDPSDLAPRLVSIAPDGARTTLEANEADRAGRFRFEVLPEQIGRYDFELTTPGRPELINPDQPISARLRVKDSAIEMRDTAARPDILRALAEQTGGRCLEVDEWQPVLDDLETLAQVREADPSIEPVFNRWPVFGLIMGCLGLQWIMRRRGGLL